MAGILDNLNGVSALWVAGMWTALWQSTVLIGVIFLIGRSAKNLAPTLRYWLWMIVGLRLIVMPFIALEVPVIAASEGGIPQASEAVRMESPPLEMGALMAPDATGLSAEALPSDGGTIGTLAPTPAPVKQATLPSTATALMFLWCLGLLVALGRLAMTCRKTRRCISEARFDDERVARVSSPVAALFGMESPPRVGVTRDAVAPFVYGAWSPVVILPECLVSQGDDEQLMVVLAHEFAHVQRRDPLLGWAFALCHALYFFHPALPFVKRQLLLERERACDARVLDLSKARPSRYARVLVSVATLCGPTPRVVPALVTSESFQDLKRRLHGLHHGTRPQQRSTPLGALAVALFGLVMAPGIVVTQQAVSAEAPERIFRVAAPEAGGRAVVAVNTADGPKTRVAATSNGEAPKARVAAVATRTLNFPADRVVGTVRVKDASLRRQIDSYYHWTDDTDWNYFATAQGNVEVPEDQHVWLTLNEDAARDPSFLRNLDPDAVYRLSTLYAEESDVSLDDKGMAEVLSLTGLRELDLLYCQVSDRGLALLPQLPHLERLSVPRKTTDTGLAHIAKVPTLSRLYIKKNNASDVGLLHLEKLQNLRELELGSGAFTDKGLAPIAKLPNLEYLMLWGQAFGDEAMRHVAQLPKLNNLNVSNLDLSNRGVQQIAEVKTLETLNLYGVKAITGLALKHLATLPNLRRLNLSSPPGEESKINGYGMSFLAECRSLEALDTPRNIDDNGLAHIATLPNLIELKTWGNNNQTNITDEGLRHIAALSKLRTLQVFGGGFTDSSLFLLSELRNLESLSFGTTARAFSNDGVAALSTLTQLKHLNLSFVKQCGVTLAALSQLNTLSGLTYLQVEGLLQDDSVLDLSGMRNLENVTFYLDGGLRDADLATFANMKKLRWLQGLTGITDAGVVHLAGLTQLDRLNMSGEGITDAGLAQLNGLSVLDTLSVTGNFTDGGLQALYPLKGLHWLTLDSDTPLSDGAQERLIANLPNLTMYNRSKLAGSTMSSRTAN